MSWRQFKTLPAGIKVEKVEKGGEEGGFSTLNTLIPPEEILNKASAVISSMTPTDRHLSEESDRRTEFCETHRRMIGGVCNRNNNLDGCLLWELIRVGEKIELAAGYGIVEGITVGDVLQWARHPEDIDRMRKDRRLLLACCEAIKPLKPVRGI